MLKAIGASSLYLATAVVVQSAVLCTASLSVGIAITRLVALLLPAAVPLTFTAASAATVVVGIFAMGALGASFSFRGVTRIEPATALGGA